MRQSNAIRVFKLLGSTSCFRRPVRAGTYEVSVLFFADSAHPETKRQLAFVGGLVIGPLYLGSVFHALSWTSHISSRPVISSASAEVLAAGCAINEGNMIKEAYKTLLGIEVHLCVVLDSKDLFLSLSTCRTPEDKSIRADVQILRYNFERHYLNRLIWIPGSLNIADSLTKKDSPLAETLQLMLFDGSLPVYLSSGESRESSTTLG